MKTCLKITRYVLLFAVLLSVLAFAVSCGEEEVSYRLTFVSDGATYDTRTVKAGVMPSLPPTPYKEGHNFIGWFYDNDTFERPFNVTDYPGGLTADLTLYAKWIDPTVLPVYTVTLDLAGKGEVSPVSVVQGQTVQIPALPDVPGYCVTKWYTDAAHTTEWDIVNGTVMADMSLYAEWGLATYHAYFMADGTLVKDIPFNMETESLADVPAVPEKNGYTGQWEVYTLELADVTVNAVYTPVTYTITYEETRGATNENPTTYNIESSVTPAPLSSEGYLFLGWYMNGTLITEITPGTTGNITLTAAWEKAPSVVTYIGALSTEHTNPTQYRLTDGTVTLTDASRTWYSFAGWYLDAAYTTPVTALNAENASENVTIYAKWETVTYRVSYYDGETLYAERTFDVDQQTWDVPAVPVRTGYQVTWSEVSVSPADLTIRAIYTPIPYAIQYENMAGGSHTNPATYTIEDTVTFTDAVRPGYNFLGWTSNGEKITAIPAGSMGTITLTAEWEIVTYRITYTNLKGASDASFPSSYSAETPTFTLPTGLTCIGYTFVGWTLDGDDVSEITLGSHGDLALTAKWTLTPYAITYEGISAGDTNPNPATYTIEDAVTLASPSRAGYKFLGWKRNGEAATTIPAGTTGAITLTAEWEIETYRITYAGLKDVSDTTFPASYTVETATFALPTGLTSNGYVFARWLANGKPVSEIAKGSHGDITLTAEWNLVLYTITYEGILAGDTNTNPATYTIEDTVTFTDAARRGYTFKGWTQGGDAVTGITAGTTGNITLTAAWETTKYSITYENTKGADTSTYPTVYTVESGIITLPALVSPNGFTFLGWTDESGILVTTIPAGSVGNRVFTATYEVTNYIVTLHPMGGSLSNKNFVVGLDQAFTLPVPKKEGHIFTGWYENTGESTQLTDENGVSITGYPFISNRILYAHYTPVQCTVWFNTNGGNTLPVATYAWGSTFDPAKHVAIKGDGAYFAGWYTADELIGFTETTKITSDVTLYAKWMESTPISTLEQFLAIPENPSGTYHFENDISLRGYEFVPWTSFSGILDGNGYSLKNFTLSNEAAVDYAMILSNTGTIKNLTISGFTFNSTHSNIGNHKTAVLTANNAGTIENCTITEGVIKIKRSSSFHYSHGSSLTFGVYAAVNSGTIKNCINEVGFDLTLSSNMTYDYNRGSSVTLTTHAGGIAGENAAGGHIELCRSTVVNTSQLSIGCNDSRVAAYLNLNLGAVVGSNYGTCINSYADMTSNVSGSRSGNTGGTMRLGGFVGYNAASIEGCSTVGSITGGTPATGYIGGFVGHNDTANGVIRSSHSDIDIVNGGYGGEIGGFVGNHSAKIMTSYASGDVSSDASSSTGGFVGYLHDGATITQSFASGNVRKPSGSIGAFIGAIGTTGTTRECYFLTNATLMVNGEYIEHAIENGNVIGKTYLELLSEELLVKSLEWDGDHWILLFDETPVLDWEIGIGHSYNATVVEPNCVDFGYTVYECTHCSRFYISDFTSAWGHTFDPADRKVYPATCTEGGYTSEVCLVCHTDVRSEYTEATGHTSLRVAEHVPPTCTEEGHNTHVCAKCGTEYDEVLPAIGHDRYVTIQYKAPTCSMSTEHGLIETEGHTAQVECATCHKVLEASVPVAPHSFKLTDTTTPANCTEDGMGTWVCEYENCKHSKQDVIPASGHLDANRDGCCDTCMLFMGLEGVTFIEITTAADLLQITENPSAAYRLMNDITLEEGVFTALCSAKRPFTGYFDGNGKTIYNLNSTGLAVGGIFAYNKGTIRKLTVSGVTADLTADGTFGAIAAQNEGTISECTVTGLIRLSLTQNLVVNEKVDQSISATAVFGGIAGVNAPSGIVYGCKLSGTVDISVVNIVDINVKSSVLYWIARNYKTYFTSGTSITFGGIVGVNNGNVEGCTANLPDDVAYTTIAGTNRVSGIKFGYSTIRIAATYGIITGVNNGTVNLNTADHAFTSSAWVMFNSTVGNTWADYYDVEITIAE